MASKPVVSNRRMRSILIGWFLSLGVSLALVAIHVFTISVSNVIYVGLLIVLLAGQYMVQSSRSYPSHQEHPYGHTHGCH